MVNLSDIKRINELASQRIPFLFIIDYKGENSIVRKLSDVNSNEILYNINGRNNIPTDYKIQYQKHFLKKKPVSIETYSKAFTLVKNNLTKGNSYLTNLTCETPIECNLSLKDIFYKSSALYKLWYNNEFVVFSPEIFVKIKNGKIVSNPMKGTIDASISNAEIAILSNKKEAAEHATIVDLIRNDLSRVATKVSVDKYRYIDKIKTHESYLLQVSSQISGKLPADYLNNLGHIINELLPAGSITGAPKKKTVEIIEQAEGYKRGFYTGIFGIFDGKNLDSGVMIRYIENENGKMIFKSGGGITVNSTLEDEYKEMIQKIYLPF
ncbi:MAG: aminodeoxychorismate synthase component I [Salinivirgaceae bacterium]|jgi:para-aminobenzoate synthetase component 1|nr:aminodeoxychorismate synthase component I [Salinivirgaceae bacterium]